MGFLWNKKFLFWNFVALILIKATLSFSVFQLASLLDGLPPIDAKEIITYTNEVRQRTNRTPLRESTVLSVTAAQKLDDMLRQQYFAHVSPAGVTPWVWFEKNQYPYVAAGENLAMGFFDARTTVKAWEQSTTHRDNLIYAGYDEIGVAVGRGVIDGVEGFIVVQLFGSTKDAGASAPVPEKPTSRLSFAGARADEEEIVAAARTETPTVLQVASTTPRFGFMARLLNRTFMLYTLLIAIIMTTYAIVVESSRRVVATTAAYVVMTVIAFAVPLLEISQVALIV